MVHSYKTGRDDETNIKRGLKLLNLAQKHGMKVMFNLRGKDWAGKNFDLKNFTKFVRKFKSHPALGMWYLYDEPKIKALPNLQKLYGILKQETPNVPVAIAMCWSIDWNKFGEAYDILMPDIYPVGVSRFSKRPARTVHRLHPTVCRLRQTSYSSRANAELACFPQDGKATQI